jgi:hypothetical protein
MKFETLLSYSYVFYCLCSWNLLFLCFLVLPVLPTHCRCRGLLLYLITLNNTHIHMHIHLVGLLLTTERPVAETSTWQYTTCIRKIHDLGGFESEIPGRERPQTNVLDLAASRIGSWNFDLVTAVGNGIIYILYLALVHYTYHVRFLLSSVISFNELMHLSVMMFGLCFLFLPVILCVLISIELPCCSYEVKLLYCIKF